MQIQDIYYISGSSRLTSPSYVEWLNRCKSQHNLTGMIQIGYQTNTREFGRFSDGNLRNW